MAAQGSVLSMLPIVLIRTLLGASRTKSTMTSLPNRLPVVVGFVLLMLPIVLAMNLFRVPGVKPWCMAFKRGVWG